MTSCERCGESLRFYRVLDLVNQDGDPEWLCVPCSATQTAHRTAQTIVDYRKGELERSRIYDLYATDRDLQRIRLIEELREQLQDDEGEPETEFRRFRQIREILEKLDGDGGRSE